MKNILPSKRTWSEKKERLNTLTIGRPAYLQGPAGDCGAEEGVNIILKRLPIIV